MSWVAVGSAAVSVAGGMLGSSKAKKAAKQQLKATRETNALNRYIYEQGRADLQPYRETGYGALGQMGRVMGLGRVNTNPAQYGYDGRQNVYQTNGQGLGGYGGGTGDYGVLGGMSPDALTGYGQQPGTYTQDGMPVEEDRYGGFEASPGFQFSYDQSMKGAERAASAGGYLPTANGGSSGRFSKEMARYSQGLASQEFGNYFNRLGVLSGVGQTATAQGIQAGQNYGANAGNAILAGGDARASGIMGSANAWQQGIQGVTSAFGDYLRNRKYQTGGRGGLDESLSRMNT